METALADEKFLAMSDLEDLDDETTVAAEGPDNDDDCEGDDDCQLVETRDEDNQEGDQDKKRCEGCFRTAGTGVCFIAKGELVVWALPPRKNLKYPGAWCRECFSVWRLVLRSHLSLSFLVVHLRSYANRLQFIIDLVAYCTLRREGKERVRKEHVRTRRRVRILLPNVWFADGALRRSHA